MNAARAVIVVLALSVVAVPVAGHVPSFPTDNTSPDSAVAVPDAAKSWSFYDYIEPGEVAYYRFSLTAGERLRVGTFTPDDGSFAPSVVVMSESFDGTDGVPGRVSVPDGMGAVVVTGERPARAEYEPFAPSATYHTASLDRPVDADAAYLVAVYEPDNRSGEVGVTVGYREEFSPTEYLTVPFDLVQVHLWEGQSPLLVVGPFALTVLAGGVLTRRRWADRSRSLVRGALALGALLVLASGVNTAVQTGVALTKTGPTAGVVVTALYVVVPLACGAWALWVAGRDASVTTTRTRAGLAVAALLSVATWAGFLVGPAVLLAVAVTPTRFVDD
ncbi:hypothetical protein [Haloarcula marina]|uniref:hypothetical protein n=1 Tax=Haloarcula marina TaxID=2961574 RepID=UPI0020B6D250|nr:hypothetical protein [Halomicroarcula marina]